MPPRATEGPKSEGQPPVPSGGCVRESSSALCLLGRPRYLYKGKKLLHIVAIGTNSLWRLCLGLFLSCVLLRSLTGSAWRRSCRTVDLLTEPGKVDAGDKWWASCRKSGWGSFLELRSKGKSARNCAHFSYLQEVKNLAEACATVASASVVDVGCFYSALPSQAPGSSPMVRFLRLVHRPPDRHRFLGNNACM